MSVHWIMLGKAINSSSLRLQSFPAHYALLECGIESHLTYVGNPSIWPETSRKINPSQELRGAQVVVIAKSFGDVALQYSIAAKEEGATLITQLRTNNISVAKDNYQPLDITDWIVTPFINEHITEAIRRINPSLINQPLVIPDPVETWLPSINECRDEPAHKKIALWIGRKRHLPSIQNVHLPSDWQLVTISDTAEADHYWETSLAAQLISECQAVVITNNYDSHLSGQSSPIRMINGFACAKPVLAPPSPVYLKTAKDGKGWIACCSTTDYYQALEKLSDRKIRRAYGKAGRKIFEKMSHSDPATKWRQFIQELLI